MHTPNEFLQLFYHRLPEWIAVICVFVSAYKALRGPDPFVKVFLPGLTVALIVVVVPLLVILTVSSGSIDMLDLRWAGGWADMWALNCDLLIVGFLVVWPHVLHRPWVGLTDEQKKQNVQTWLTAYAAIATVALIFTLHFIRGGQLTHYNLWVVIAAGIGIVTLLMPFYSTLAGACLQYGCHPLEWLKAQGPALGMMWNPTGWLPWLKRAANQQPAEAGPVAAAPAGNGQQPAQAAQP